MATETNDTTPEKSTEKTSPSLEKSHPDDFRGVRYTTTPEFAFWMVDSGWFRAEHEKAEAAEVMLEIRDRLDEPGRVEGVTISVNHEYDDGRVESVADLDPDTAAELALTILDEVGDSL